MAKANMLVDEALAEVRKIHRYLEWAALTVLVALGARSLGGNLKACRD
jgi:hypothetical protein